MAKIVRALRSAGVRVIACPDLDFLDDAATVKKLVEAFGGAWGNYYETYAKAVHNLRATPVEITCRQMLAQVEAALSGKLDEAWTEDMKKVVRPAMRLSLIHI